MVTEKNANGLTRLTVQSTFHRVTIHSVDHRRATRLKPGPSTACLGTWRQVPKTPHASVSLSEQRGP